MGNLDDPMPVGHVATKAEVAVVAKEDFQDSSLLKMYNIKELCEAISKLRRTQ